MLAELLPQLPHRHPGLHALIARLHEEGVRAGHVPSGASLRAWLGELRGSSKAAGSARALLAAAG